MLKIFTFLLSIFILVSLHELGHLIMARICKVKVIRYSIGFGKPIFSKILFGIEWSLSPILFGGYVKMLDTREGLVKESEIKYAFDKQHPFKRILIILAGPVTNLILSILIYIFVFSFGVKDIKPIVVSIIPGSIAQNIGFKSFDEVLTINNKNINSFEELVYILMTQLDTRDKVVINVLGGNNTFRDININTLDYKDDIKNLFKNREIGILPFRYTNIVSKIVPESPADQAGIKVGDQLEFINDNKINDWFYFNDFIKSNGGRELNIRIIRKDYNFDDIMNNMPGMSVNKGLNIRNLEYNFKVTPNIVEVDHGTKIQGFIGIYPLIDDRFIDKVYTYKKLEFNEIIKRSFSRTLFYSNLTLDLFVDLVLFRASFSNIGGPVAIANITSEAIKVSFLSYLEILALLSISLGILNLLPIPPLDGGNILYCIIEWIKGSPLSNKVQGIGLKIGMFIIFLLVIISFINDFRNIFG